MYRPQPTLVGSSSWGEAKGDASFSTGLQALDLAGLLSTSSQFPSSTGRDSRSTGSATGVAVGPPATDLLMKPLMTSRFRCLAGVSADDSRRTFEAPASVEVMAGGAGCSAAAGVDTPFCWARSCSSSRSFNCCSYLSVNCALYWISAACKSNQGVVSKEICGVRPETENFINGTCYGKKNTFNWSVFYFLHSNFE